MSKILIDEAVVRQALEALKKYHYYTLDAGLPNQSMLNEGFTAFTDLRQALDQPAQERPQNCGTGYCSCIECLYEQPAPAQEPDPDALTAAYMSGLYEGKNRKPWVGLTHGEIDDALDAAKVSELPVGWKSVKWEIARAIDAALLAKNGITKGGAA